MTTVGPQREGSVTQIAQISHGLAISRPAKPRLVQDGLFEFRVRNLTFRCGCRDPKSADKAGYQENSSRFHFYPISEGRHQLSPLLFIKNRLARGKLCDKYKKATPAEAGSLRQDDVIGALDHARIAEGPGGPAEMVPGQHHVRMNIYIAQAKNRRFEIAKSLGPIDPRDAMVSVAQS